MNALRTMALKAISAVGIALTLASPGSAEMTETEAKLYAAAKSAHENVTWYITHFSIDTAEALGRTFEAKYPGVPLNVIRTTAQVAFQRLNLEIKNNQSNCDIFSSTDLGHYTTLKSKGLLLKYEPENAAKAQPQFRGLDPDGTFHITSAGLVLITYNKEKLKDKELPKKWTDLIEPKWKNEITVGHPGYSAYVGTWVLQMRKLYGWDYFTKLEANKPQIGRSINDTVTMLTAGERSVGAGPLATTLKSAAKGNPLGVIYPEDGALFMVAPSAIMQSTKNPNAARLFMEFLFSVAASKASVDDFNEPIRPEVAPSPGAMPLSQVKTIQPTIGEIEKGMPEVIEAWRDLFGG